jgi:transcriptional regulator with XRE-family HTH domain
VNQQFHSFGALLRRRRKALDLTQQALAERVSCSSFAIRKIEADERRPSQRLAERLADRLEVKCAERKAFLEAARSVHAARELMANTEPIESTFNLPEEPEPWLQGLGRIPFVGRAQELKQLVELLEQLQSGTGFAALVQGEAGIGKSRLMREVMRRARNLGTRVLHASCYEIEQSMPYQPVIELVTQLTGQASRALQAGMSPGSLAEIASLAPELAGHLQSLPPLSDQLPEARQVRLFRAIAQAFETVAEDAALLIVVDDLHWVDAASLQFLHYLSRHIAQRRILLMLAYRGEDAAAESRLAALLSNIRRSAHTRNLQLHRLSADEIRDFLIAAEVPALRRPGLDQWLHRETEGHPFFLVSILQSLLEQGVLTQEQEGICFDKPVPSAAGSAHLSLPEALRESVRSRLAHLPHAVRTILDAASVLGRQFDFDTLRALTRVAVSELLDALDVLVARGLLREEAEVGQYDFSHDKVREAVYLDISAARRRQLHLCAALMHEAAYDSQRKDGRAHLHAQIAEILERDSFEQIENKPDLLAYHFTQAGLHERAVPYWILAGQRCLKMFAFAEAEAMANRARRHLSLLPQVERIKLHTQLLKILVYPGVRLRRPDGLGSEIAGLCREAQEAGLVSELSDGLSLLSWLYHLTWADFPRAKANVVAMINLLQKLPAPQNIEALVSGARCLAVMEIHMPKALQMFDELAAFGPAAVDTVYYQWGLGLVKRWEGDDERARNALTRGANLARERGDPWAEFECMAALAAAELEAGQPNVVTALCEALEPLAAKIGEGGSERAMIDALAALAATARDEPDGEIALQSSIRLLEKMDAKYILGYILNSASEICARLERWARASEHARAGLQAAMIAERAQEIARSHVLLALAARARGNEREATEHLYQVEQSHLEQLPARARLVFERLRITVEPGSARR